MQTVNWTLTIERYLAEGRTVSGGKGDQIAKQNEQLQLDLNRQLMQTFTTQFGKQSQILDQLTKKLQPMIDNPQGFSPEALTALRTSASDTNAQTLNSARTALQDQLNARGGLATSGVDAQIRAQLESAGAGQEARSQNQITLENENQKQQSFWNAINALSGNAAQLNPLGYAGGATAGANATANLSQAFTASNQSQLLGALGGIAGGVGSALSGRFGR